MEMVEVHFYHLWLLVKMVEVVTMADVVVIDG